jgi:methionyl-tRNA formyltransferase
MNLVILTNDNFFSFTVLEDLLELRKPEIKLIVFSSAIIGKKGLIASIKWLFSHSGFRHTAFKLLAYGVFRFLRLLCVLFPFISNHCSSYLWTKRNNVNHFFASDVNSKDVVDKIKSVSPDLIISASMNQIIKKPILEMPPSGCINVHCAPLPRYGGMSPYVWALANNEDHSAATIHYMEEGLDTGDIIVQEKINVAKNDSAFALFYRCCLRARELLPAVLESIQDSTVESYHQDLSQKSYFSWPDKRAIANLRKNGYRLATTADFLCAVFKQCSRIK